METLLEELPTEITDPTNPDAPTKERLIEAIKDVTSLKSNKERIITCMHIIFGVLKGKAEDPAINFDAKNPNERKAIAIKILEGITNCSEGFEDRLNEIIIGFYQPATMAEYAEFFRFEIMKEVAQSFTDEVHGQNYVSRLAPSVNYGTKAINDKDPTGPQDDEFPDDEEILTRLSEALETSYTPLLFLQFLENQLRAKCGIIGYHGPAASYDFPEYSAMEKEIQKFIPDATPMEIFTGELAKYDADDVEGESYLAVVKDVNWSFIRKKIIERITNEGLFTNPAQITNPIEMIPEFVDELEYWVFCEPSVDQLNIWLLSQPEYLKAFCHLLCVLPITHAVIKEHLKNVTSSDMQSDFALELKNSTVLFKKSGFIGKFLLILKELSQDIQVDIFSQDNLVNMLQHADSTAFGQIISHLNTHVTVPKIRKIFEKFDDIKMVWTVVLKSGEKTVKLMQLLEKAKIALPYRSIITWQRQRLDETDMYHQQELFIVQAHIDQKQGTNTAEQLFENICINDEGHAKLFSFIRKCKLNPETKPILEKALINRQIIIHFHQMTPAVADHYLDILKFIIHMDDAIARGKLLNAIKLEQYTDANCLLSIIQVLSEAEEFPSKLTNLAVKNISRLLYSKMDIICEQNLLPHKVRLLLLHDPALVLAELAHHKEYLLMDFTKEEVKNFEKIFKVEHWYQIAKQGLLPDKIIKSHKEDILEYIRCEDDSERKKDIQASLEYSDTHLYHFFRIQRGWLPTNENRGSLKKLVTMRDATTKESVEQDSCLYNLLCGGG